MLVGFATSLAKKCDLDKTFGHWHPQSCETRAATSSPPQLSLCRATSAAGTWLAHERPWLLTVMHEPAWGEPEPPPGTPPNLQCQPPTQREAERTLKRVVSRGCQAKSFGITRGVLLARMGPMFFSVKESSGSPSK